MSDILQSKSLTEIQQQLSLGLADAKNCQECVQSENRSGLSSLRQHYLKYYPTISPGKITFNSIDVRWNNTCNLNCMYCTPTFSSTWADKLGIVNLSPVKDYQDDLLKFILQHASDVNEIMLVGGEPMLMKQNYRLLNELPLLTRISILTNLSYDLKNLPCINDLLKRPRRNIVWNISVENINEQFEYVRHGGSWQQLEKNINFLLTHWRDQVTVNMVYSMFSAFDLVSTIKKFHALGLKKFNLQGYFGDPHMDVFKMPKSIQLMALDQLEQAEKMHYDNIHQDDRQLFTIQNIELLKSNLVQITKSDVLSKDGFLKRIEWYDQWNSQKFHRLWPHVIDLVEQHLD